MRRHLAWRLLLPVGLGVLVVALAVLQYRWLGQVGESERQELRHSLERRSQDFSAEFDNEMGRLRAAFASLVDQPDPELAVAIAKQLTAWRPSTSYPDVIEALYVVAADGPHETVLTFDESRRVLSPSPAPSDLAPVLDRLAVKVVETDRPDSKSFTRLVARDGEAFDGRIPAELIWLPRKEVLPFTPGRWLGFSPAATDALLRMPASDRVLIVRLSRQVIAGRLLPTMLAHHFGDGPPAQRPTGATRPARLPQRLYERGLALRLEILDADNGPVFTSGLEQGELIPPERADVRTALFVSHADAARPQGNVFLAWTNPKTAATQDARFNVRIERQEIVGAKTAQESWYLLVQHGAGSLDQAVALTRRRNLYLSFGILSVLAVAMGLVVGNAQRSERLAAQQMEFVATVSHELRTPVAVIRSAAENLSSGIVHDPARARQYGELIESEGRRLTDMIEHVLEHADIRTNRPALRRTDVDVSQLVRETVGAYGPMIQRAGMTIDLSIAPNLPSLPGDEASLRRAIENLLTNAVKHGADGKWIGVTARLAPGDSRHVIRDRRPGARVQSRPVDVIELVISDHGPGVDPADRDHLFEAFYRGRRALDRQIQGSGLGLGLVKRIAEEHGGRVELQETPGGGATFLLRLPVLPDLSSPNLTTHT
ncbi:MAG: HAMP domain-containing sensor histidine kinase [Acidobacteriota bacterium]